MQVVQVGQEPLGDRLVGLAHERCGGLPAREEHEAAARPARPVAAQRVGLVGEHVEDPARGRHRVDAVPRHRSRLVRLDRHAEERAVRHPLQRGRRLPGHRGDERRREGGLHRDDHLPRRHAREAAFVEMVDDDVGALRAQCGDAAPGPGARTERVAQRGRKPAGAAQEVPGDERLAASPHEREQPQAAAGGELGQLRRGAVSGAGEDRLDRRWQRAEELRERPVVLEREDTRPHVGRRLARPGEDARR